MVGVLTHPIRTVKQLKERVGSLMDTIFNKEKDNKHLPPSLPKRPGKETENNEVKHEPINNTPTVEDKKPPKDLLVDEYKIVYGTEPNVNGDVYKNYCQRVEKERQAEAPNMSMNDYLITRQKELDNMFVGDRALLLHEKDQNKYKIKMLQNDRGRFSILNEARQSLMQSNLTGENYVNALTLTHFKKYIKHFVAKDEVVADGSRNISLNPVLKNKYKKENSKVVITDLNQYLIEGKPLDQCQNKVRASDARQHMEVVRRNNQKQCEH